MPFRYPSIVRKTFCFSTLLILVSSLGMRQAWAQGSATPALPAGGTWLKAPAQITTGFLLDSLIKPIMRQELGTHLSALGNAGDALPAYALGHPLGGDFMGPSFAESFAAMGALDGTGKVGGRPVLPYMKYWLLSEADKAHTFSQLFTVRTLAFYQSTGAKGAGLKANTLWQQMDSTERTKLKAALDFRRSYDPTTKMPANGRPYNYLAVGLLVGAEAKALGFSYDDAALLELAQLCANAIIKGEGMLDDDKQGRGRYDRYGREFAQFTYEALKLLGQESLRKKIEPHVKRVNQLWLDMVNPQTGYAFPYGRSLQNSWEDAWEQCAFMANNPEVSPTTLPIIAGVFTQAWRHFWAYQYNTRTHVTRMRETGRGVYSYITPNRVFILSVHTLGKAAISAMQMQQALTKAKLASWASTPTLPMVNRWVSIPHADGKRQMGWWLVRNPGNYLVLPVVGSFKNSANSDYLPAPYGFTGVEFPVSQQVPALVPHFLLRNGMTITTAEGADSIKQVDGGTALRMVWNNMTNLNGQLIDANLKAVTTWKWEDKELTYTLELLPKEDMVIDAFDFWVPTSLDKADLSSGTVFNDRGQIMRVSLTADWEANLILASTQGKEMGNGAFSPIPLVLQYKGANFPLLKGRTYQLKLKLQHMGE